MTEPVNYPGVAEHLDDSLEYTNTFEESTVDGEERLTVTQTSDIDAGRVEFRKSGDTWVPIPPAIEPDMEGEDRLHNREITGNEHSSRNPSSPADHEKVHNLIQSQVNVFSSRTGPDGGNLACVWAVRHLAHKALGRWITGTDATAIFDQELQRYFDGTWQDNEVSAGGIVISPTATIGGRRRVGHVGLLGPSGNGLSRKIYSNSSSRARWEQNFTLERWINLYRGSKGLRVRFYPLPVT